MNGRLTVILHCWRPAGFAVAAGRGSRQLTAGLRPSLGAPPGSLRGQHHGEPCRFPTGMGWPSLSRPQHGTDIGSSILAQNARNWPQRVHQIEWNIRPMKKQFAHAVDETNVFYGTFVC
eukprot:scaffold165293_cov39-Prasinocladus_malaysianus.AAC.1